MYPKPVAAMFAAVDLFLLGAIAFVAVEVDHLMVYVAVGIVAAPVAVALPFYLTLLTGRTWLPRQHGRE